MLTVFSRGVNLYYAVILLDRYWKNDLTFRLPSYLLKHRLPKGCGGYHPLDLVFGSQYCIVWYSHWCSIAFWL